MQESPVREHLVAPASDNDLEKRISGINVEGKLNKAGLIGTESRLEEASCPGDAIPTDEPESPSARLGRNRGSTLVDKLGVASHSDGFHGAPEPARSLNRMQSFILWLMMLFMGTQLSLPYILSVYLVRDFYEGEGASEQSIGQLTGLLAAAQSFSRSLTAYPWGLLSDIFGRKVCILIGTLASSTSILGFGISRSYTSAILARAIPALFVGSPVALKSMIGDACDQTGQAKAMAIFNLGHGLGTVLGPALGGSLAYPCKQFPGFPFCGSNGILQQRPFLLPCLAVGALGLVAFLCSALLLLETHPRVVSCSGGWCGNLVRVLCCHTTPPGGAEEEEDLHERLLEHRLSMRSSDVEMGRLSSQRARELAGKQKLLDSGTTGADPRRLIRLDSEVSSGSLQPHQSGFSEPTPGEGEERAGVGASRVRDDHSAWDEAEETALLLREESADASTSKSKQEPDFRWWRDKNVRVALIASGMCAFLYNFQDEMAPIFVSAPMKQGGLSMPLEDFTLPISFGGVALVVFSLGLYPRLIKRFGALTMCRAGLLLGIPATLILPLASLFTGVNFLEQACVFVAVGFNSIAKVCALNSSMIAVNLVAPKAAMGAVNGGSMTLQSGGRALGPLLSGMVWAAVVSLHVAGQQFVAFSLPAIGFALTQFLYRGLELPARPK